MTTTVRPLIAGNWKMNLDRAAAEALVTTLAGKMAGPDAPACDMLVCPPAVLIPRVADALKTTAGGTSAIGVGGQDCHFNDKGAHTGDTSPLMLLDAGCKAVILGHSERRADHGETDALVRSKAAAALKTGLMAIICVGETLEQRDAGQVEAVVGTQLAGSIPEGATASNTVIAYEPVWAIGTGRTPTPEDIASIHAFIRAEIQGKIADADSVRLLYGGSVNAKNAAEILAMANVNGGLVGGASLKADDFWTIATSVPK